MNSSLADVHRLVALDIRGHGLSDKPHDAYSDSKLWADDVNAVIQTLNLDHPVLSGWSYGPLVFLDYIRHYGDDELGGLQFVGAVTKLGSAEAMSTSGQKSCSSPSRYSGILLRHTSPKPVSGQSSVDERSSLRFRLFEAEEVNVATSVAGDG